ncbi:D-tyrosyl-tRNA(Tyr) deacylase [Desulfurobacterium thermolithotrophum DSM 11699]|uniref:D-aminoacyl-tRNA deacylase n=1 Tax=Desulfurobacterium thermolithotrophum (strain DSM 11699 / BSA) TaxID=868864 RepID=F0S3F6_DESTD|nr:D-aminoacyl-tRNA deacylase [Desulfurobacterium thermolithotrophum]ADY73378.1 D-tyrosyl-tRNA(Tyr) deacylase [Desulfurobacterium thermolithotrophum DSM 11699]
MKVVLQRVLSGKVIVAGEVVGEIGQGIVVLVGFEKGDINSYIDKMADKIINLRIFEDATGKMNLSLKDVNGALLIVPNFTLAADCRKGRRPSFQSSEDPEKAEEMFKKFVEKCKEFGVEVQTGIFGADMKVHIVNDGPVTFILNSKDFS